MPQWIVRYRLASLVLAAGAVASCGHREAFPVDGVWFRGGVSGDHSGIVVLSLRLENERVVGQACRNDTGHLIYKDVPVDGPYPRVVFNDLYGCRFQGGVVSAEAIDGLRRCPGETGPGQEWFFRRSVPSSYDECAAASP
jgi:hypothetical protein